MSDIKEETLKAIEETAKLEKLKAENTANKALLDSKLIKNRLKSVIENENEVEIAKNASYGALSQEEIAKIVKDNDSYMDAAQKPMLFVCKTFNEIIPFFRKNIILVGAKTGEGKSTAVANIAYSTLTDKLKPGQRIPRILVITNEEMREDFYNRITSLHKGWHYTNHSNFTPEQRKAYSDMIPRWAASGRITVIDNTHGGSHGVTTTLEGMEAIFTSLIENKEYYDVILIDYYQNVISSKMNPNLDQYKIQEKFGRMLDNFKNIYPAPIVLMAQLRAQTEKEKGAPFQQRLMGSKSIMTNVTAAIEMIIDRKNLKTKWVLHKSRYTEGMGKDFWTGYDKGRFVEYTTAFAEKVQKQAYERESRKMNAVIDQNNGIKDVFKKDENKEGK